MHPVKSRSVLFNSPNLTSATDTIASAYWPVISDQRQTRFRSADRGSQPFLGHVLDGTILAIVRPGVSSDPSTDVGPVGAQTPSVSSGPFDLAGTEGRRAGAALEGDGLSRCCRPASKAPPKYREVEHRAESPERHQIHGSTDEPGDQ